MAKMISLDALQDNLVGVYELAQHMGVSKSRITQYARAAWFPKPMSSPQMGRVWYLPDALAAWEDHKKTLERHRPPADYGTPGGTE